MHNCSVPLPSRVWRTVVTVDHDGCQSSDIHTDCLPTADFYVPFGCIHDTIKAVVSVEYGDALMPRPTCVPSPSADCDSRQFDYRGMLNENSTVDY